MLSRFNNQKFRAFIRCYISKKNTKEIEKMTILLKAIVLNYKIASMQKSLWTGFRNILEKYINKTFLQVD